MKLKISSFLNLIFILFTNHQLQLYRQISDFSTSTETEGTSKRLPPNGLCRLTSVKSSFFKVTLLISAALKSLKFHQSFITMCRNPSLNSSTDSDVFYVEQSSPERSPIRNNTPAILNSTQLSGAMEPESITISSVVSPEPQIMTIDSDSKNSNSN